MEEIRRQVSGARRRLVLQQFLAISPWCLFAALLVAAVGLAIPKIWFLELDAQSWTTAWTGGAVGVGLVTAVVWTFVRRRNMMDAAIEVDKRFGLKERVSSALALSRDERESEVGRALIEDASRRVGTLGVSDEFGFSATWRTLLPLVPALLVFVLVTFVPDASQESVNAAADTAELRDRIKKSTEELRKRLAERRKSAEQHGLEEAEELFKKIQQGLDDLANDNKVDRKKALVKINDLAKEIEKRRSVLGDSEKMKQQFNRLKNMQRGPAERIVNALKDGNLLKALGQVKQLSEKIKTGELSAEEQKKLAEQLERMKDKLQEMIEAHQRAKRDLEEQIKRKEEAGDLEAAGKLQRKLDQLQQQDRQMERMNRLAQQLQQCSASLQEGKNSDAASRLSDMISELKDMQGEMDELATLDEMMDEIASAKDSLSNKDGDMSSSFDAMLDQFSDMSSNGMGEGLGFGYRPEQETETGEYEARERAKPKAGEAVRIGDAFGPNQSGMSMEGVKQQIVSSLANDADPLTDQRLPKAQQDHIRQYYQRFNEAR